MIPGRVRVVGAALRRQSIKCSYARVGTGARGDPRARRTPLEGGVSPRARRTAPEGGVSPRARRTSLEGGREPSSEADLTRGGCDLSSEADLARGDALLCCFGGPWGPPWCGLCRACVLGSRLARVLRFFAGFKQDFLGYLGTLMAVPDSSPRASAGVSVRIPRMLMLTDETFFPPRCQCSSMGPRQRTCGSCPRSPAGA
jgi:hypothetical protein